MKKILTLFLAAILVIACAAPAFAAVSDYKFIVEVDDGTVTVGDTVKVSFKIESKDGGDFKIYAMQDYIGFDTEFFEFVEGSLNVTNGFTATAQVDATKQVDCVFVNRYSGSKDFGNGDTVLSFELKALKSGETSFTHSIVEMIDDDLNFYSVEKVGADVAVSSSSGSTVTRYDISIDYNSRYGDVDVSRDRAAAGTKITVTPTPKTGYEVDEVIVTKDSNGKSVRVTENTVKGTYTFTMPEDDVTIEVVFVSSVGTGCKITLDDSYENGEVAISHKRAEKGEIVDIFPEPDEGYEVDTVEVVKTSSGTSVKVTANNDGSYSFKMPEAKVTISVTFKEKTTTDKPDDTTSDPTPGTTPGGEIIHICPSKPYADVDQSLWYHAAIDYAISYNLMNGYDAVTFGPNDTTTRAMIATIIWRLEGSPKSTAAIPFSDISEGQWYSEAIRWTAENGIVNGLGDGTFAPEMAITREQFAAMIYRYEQYKGGGFTGLWMYQLKFPDLDSLSSWAVEAISWCNMNGIIKGNGMGYLNPLGEATRAEAAQILMNYKTMAK